MSNANPVFTADGTFNSVEEVSHHGFFREGVLVLVHRLDFDDFDAAVSHRVVVFIAVRLLNDNFVLKSRDIGGNINDRVLVAQCHAGGCSERERCRRT